MTKAAQREACDTLTDPLAAIPEFLKTRPTKEELYAFLAQLDRDHPKEHARLIGVGILFELVEHMKQYPPHVIESMACGAERLLQELEPFGDHPEDFFAPLLNAGWIKGETLIDRENPPNLANLVRLKIMLDRQEARKRGKSHSVSKPRMDEESSKGKVKANEKALQMLNDKTAGPPGRGRLARMAQNIASEVGMTSKSVENAIREIVREWERKHPGR